MAGGASAAGGLPDLSDALGPTDACVQGFREKGHIVVRGLASPEEIAAYRPVIAAAAQQHRWERRPLEERGTYGKAFLQVPNLWVRDERVRAFVLSRRFAQVAAALLGVRAVRLYHDQALFKEEGGGYTPWHQDQFYWPLDTPHTISMWMPLVDVSEEIGSMFFASGSHRLGDLGDYAIGDESQRAFDAIIAERGLEVETHGSLAAGDATFHAGWTLHSAPANRTGMLREVMTIIYFADGTHVSPRIRPGQRFDHEAWLPDCPPGTPAASPLNPLLD